MYAVRGSLTAIRSVERNMNETNMDHPAAGQPLLAPRPETNEQATHHAKVALVACRVLDVELDHLATECPNLVHIHWMEQGLHNEPDQLAQQLQQAVREVETNYPQVDTIALGYGYCSRGIENVTATRCRLVVARAHDCITLLLGSKERYARYVADHPGTYWYSPGWNKHHIPPGPERYNMRLAEYTEKYGQDNAAYLMETEQHWFSTYDRATYVHLTIGVTDTDLEYTRACADWLGWKYDEQQGDLALLRDLLTGPWDDERFLVLEPGHAATLSNDDRVLKINHNPKSE